MGKTICLILILLNVCAVASAESPASKHLEPARLVTVLKELRADDPALRVKAIRTLGASYPPRPRVLLPLLEDQDATVREAAEEALALTGPAAVPEIASVIVSEKFSTGAKSCAVRVLGRIGDPAGYGAIAGALVEGVPGVNEDLSLMTLARGGLPAVRHLLRCLGEESRREKAMVGLALIHQTKVAVALTKVMNDPEQDLELRLAAADYIRETTVAADAPQRQDALMQFYMGLTMDPSSLGEQRAAVEKTFHELQAGMDPKKGRFVYLRYRYRSLEEPYVNMQQAYCMPRPVVKAMSSMFAGTGGGGMRADVARLLASMVLLGERKEMERAVQSIWDGETLIAMSESASADEKAAAAYLLRFFAQDLDASQALVRLLADPDRKVFLLAAESVREENMAQAVAALRDAMQRWSEDREVANACQKTLALLDGTGTKLDAKRGSLEGYSLEGLALNPAGPVKVDDTPPEGEEAETPSVDCSAWVPKLMNVEEWKKVIGETRGGGERAGFLRVSSGGFAVREERGEEDKARQEEAERLRAERERVIRKLGEGRCTGALDVLVEIYHEGYERDLGMVLVEAIAAIDTKMGRSLFYEDLASPSAQLRARGVRGLGIAGSDDSVTDIVAAVYDDTGVVRNAAFEALGRLRFGALKTHLTALLNESDGCVVSRSIEVVKTRARKESLTKEDLDSGLLEAIIDVVEKDWGDLQCMGGGRKGAKYPAIEAAAALHNVFASRTSGQGGPLLDTSLQERVVDLIEDDDVDIAARCHLACCLLSAGWSGQLEETVAGGDVDRVADLYFAYILAGIAASEPLLVEALLTEGTPEMYWVYKGSGRKGLQQAAQSWLDDYTGSPVELRNGSSSCNARWASVEAVATR